ncbi:MAG: XdhC family protein [Dehalococcoidia bacterium]|nr:XdhC family protein [Dehalococcoidia bacterium]
MAALTDLRVVVDIRPEYATAAHFPEATVVIVSDFETAFDKLKVSTGSIVVIISTNTEGNEVALESALKMPANYTDMIGSKDKNDTVFSHLTAKASSPKTILLAYTPLSDSTPVPRRQRKSPPASPAR